MKTLMALPAVLLLASSGCTATGQWASKTNGPIDWTVTINKSCGVIGDFTQGADLALAADPKILNAADMVIYGDVKKAFSDGCGKTSPTDLGAAAASLAIAVADIVILGKDLKTTGVVK